MLVANCTTPAQYFHLLRRQMYGGPDRRGTRKPLVIFTPKSLLRHPRAVSTLHDFTGGGFIEILPDLTADRQTVSRVVFCSGKIYYDLLLAREERKIDHVALVRVEQLYPFAAGQAAEILSAYEKTAEVVWVQEEPRNMGAWRFVQEQMQPILESTQRVLRYAGRAPSASPASGSLKRHQEELADLLDQALSGEVKLVETKRRVPTRRRR
jgi:2-oxoglutarate dehydrogenase E1 component